MKEEAYKKLGNVYLLIVIMHVAVVFDDDVILKRLLPEVCFKWGILVRYIVQLGVELRVFGNKVRLIMS